MPFSAIVFRAARLLMVVHEKKRGSGDVKIFADEVASYAGPAEFGIRARV
jgi:hypothetical protein